MKLPFHRFALEQAALTVVYYLAGLLGLGLGFVNPSAVAIWVPAGIALAAFILAGVRVWPAILLGAFLVNLTAFGGLPAALLIAIGNTLAALLGARLVQQFAHGRNAFGCASDVFKFALFGGLLASMVSATVGTLTLCAYGLVLWENAPTVWAVWWMGTTTGALVIGSVLTLVAQMPRLTWTRAQALETGLLFLGFLAVGLVTFSPFSQSGVYDYPLYLAIIPLILWSAFRQRQVETTGATLLLALGAIGGTLHGYGPFARYDGNTALLLLQVFIVLIALIGLIVAAEVHNRRHIEEELREREELYHLVIESAADAILTVDENSVITYINCSTERLFGYNRQQLVGRELGLVVMIPDLKQSPHLSGLVRYLTSGPDVLGRSSREAMGRHQDGREIPLEVTFGKHPGKRRLFTGIIRDISERVHDESDRRWLATIVASSDDAVVGKDLNGIVRSWNRSAERIYGYSAEEFIGQPVDRLFPPERFAEQAGIMDRVRLGETVEHFETERICKNGSRIHISLTVSPVDDGVGRIIGASSVSRDITERIQADAQIRFLANHDVLTGLPNRLNFREKLTLAIINAARETRKVAVLFIDLDRFKEINDSLGHDAGDQLLRMVGQRLRDGLRIDDFVARLGGDEFVILLRGDTTMDEALMVGQEVLELLRQPLHLMDQNLHISASIGVGLFPDDGADEIALMRCADEAMYRAKQGGRGNCQSFAVSESGAASSTVPRVPTGREVTRHPTGVHTLPLLPPRKKV